MPIFWDANPNVFQYSLQPDWHTDNGIFKRPILAHMQVLVPRGAQKQDFSAVSQGDLTRSLVLSVAQASVEAVLHIFPLKIRRQTP